ncbi:similar to Kazachstania africana KAFR_0G02900 hypothetical protein [Maudiozyma saulgeensis]|uniref:Uncharacterized protein n=1 Tax=Maudiozyma saulgeensis TaxID=1789683 RepID=A0A1X7RAB0_9SACH|nr:similar to Kazachstania africana KAFR_0G02900 hypothetical protein [Kazachstania saulgeensis]
MNISTNTSFIENNILFKTAAVDYTDVNLNIALNIITLTSTFITCSAAPLGGFAAGSCVFNSLAFISSLMLNILVGMDNALPETSTVNDLFTKIGEDLGTKLLETKSHLLNNTIAKMSTLGDIFNYEISEDGLKCVSVQIGKLGGSILPGVKESVCITPFGIEMITKSHRISFGTLVNNLRKKLSNEENNGYTREVVNTYAKYGTVSSTIIDKLGELSNNFVTNKLTDQNKKISVTIEHDNKLMFQIALELI